MKQSRPTLFSTIRINSQIETPVHQALFLLTDEKRSSPALPLRNKNTAPESEPEPETFTKGDTSGDISNNLKRTVKSRSRSRSRSKLCLSTESKKYSQVDNEIKVDVQRNDEKPQVEVKMNQVEPSLSNEKSTISYSDFLNLFKSPSAEKMPQTHVEVEDGHIDIDNQTHTPQVDNLDSSLVKCKTITSFFSRSVKKKVEIQPVSSLITVTAEIHNSSGEEPSKKNACQDRSRSRLLHKEGNMKKKSNMSWSPEEAIDSEDIILLSSEVVDENESEDQDKRKRKWEESASASSIGLKKLKTDSILKAEHQPFKNVFTGKAFKVEKGSETKKEGKTSLAISMKSSQTTLCFEKGGLSLANSKGRDASTSAKSPPSKGEEIVKSTSKAAVNLSTETLSMVSKLHENSLEQKSPGTITTNVETMEDERNISNLRKEEAAKEESIKCSPKEILGPSKRTEFKKLSSESPGQISDCQGGTEGPRRSSRITRSVQAMKEIAVIELDGGSDQDSGGESANDKAKSKQKMRSTSKRTAVSSIKDNAGKKGKLAPIFTKVKPVEEESKKEVLQEDPEKARLRREFLMSGVPEELKKLIAASTTTPMVSDYPPLPVHSHIQQFSDSNANLTVAVPRHRLHCTKDRDGMISSILSLDLGWRKLGFTTTVDETLKSQTSYCFKNFSHHPKLLEFQAAAILKDFQSSDPLFPFKEMHTCLQTRQTEAMLDAAVEQCGEPLPSKCGSVVVIDDDSPTQVSKKKMPLDEKCCLWSDLHQPRSSKEMIGNAKLISQLKNWLVEWKGIIQKEAHKANQRGRKGNASIGNVKEKGTSWSDDSDFTDSEDEELCLCNTKLITGPHGVGKTAAVYALARELGYKVFEVSASSLRSGKQLLSQLEEATQSHRVTQNKSTSKPGNSGTPLPGASSLNPKGKTIDNHNTEKSKSKTKPKASLMASAFANLFKSKDPNAEHSEQNKKSGKEEKFRNSSNKKSDIKDDVTHSKEKGTQSGADKSEKPKSKRGRKRKDEAPNKKSASTVDVLDVVAKDVSGSLNLTSSSVILFDEADVIFEDDRGFLATLQHFMMSTKIPIILTARDIALQEQLAARHELLVFKHPSVTTIASFLCTVCLSHGVRVHHSSMSNIVQLMKSDIRQLLLNLQYWCESGGGRNQATQAVKFSNSSSSCNTSKEFVTKSRSTTSEDQVEIAKHAANYSDGDSTDTDDFVCLRPLSKRPRQILEDDDSNSMMSLSSKEAKESKEEGSNKVPKSAQKLGVNPGVKTYGEDTTMETEMEAASSNLPLLHMRCDEDLAGLFCGTSRSQYLVDLIQACRLDLNSYIPLRQVFGNDIVTQLALHSLSLPKGATPHVTQLVLPAPSPQSSLTVKTRKRIIVGDWLDSDSSNDDSGAIQCNDQGVSTNSATQPLVGPECQPADLEADGSEIVSSNFNENGNIKDSNKGAESAENKVSISILMEFAKYYENISFIDAVLAEDRLDYEHMLDPGMSDEEIMTESCHRFDWCSDASWNMQLLSARNLHCGVNRHLDQACVKSELSRCQVPGVQSHSQYEDGSEKRDQTSQILDSGQVPDSLSIPVGQELPDLWTLSQDKHLRRKKDPMLKDVCKYVGPFSNKAPLHTDYMPGLREICRSEGTRLASNTKRRFHHYLDSVGMGLKPSTLTSLATTYTVRENPE